jgi:hypothetical protein
VGLNDNVMTYLDLGRNTMQTVYQVSSTQTEILTRNLSNKPLGYGVSKLFLKQGYNNYGGLVRQLYVG